MKWLASTENADQRLRFFSPFFNSFTVVLMQFHSHLDRRETCNFRIYIYIFERKCTWPKENAKKKKNRKRNRQFFTIIYLFRILSMMRFIKMRLFFLVFICRYVQWTIGTEAGLGFNDIIPVQCAHQTYETVCSHAWATSFVRLSYSVLLLYILIFNQAKLLSVQIHWNKHRNANSE